MQKKIEIKFFVPRNFYRLFLSMYGLFFIMLIRTFLQDLYFSTHYIVFAVSLIGAITILSIAIFYTVMWIKINKSNIVIESGRLKGESCANSLERPKNFDWFKIEKIDINVREILQVEHFYEKGKDSIKVITKNQTYYLHYVFNYQKTMLELNALIEIMKEERWH
ncbi:hypothetical protein [Mycoplasma sp. 5370]